MKGFAPKAIAVIAIIFLASRAFASSGSQTNIIDELPRVLLALLVALVATKIGGEISVRLGQPAVLGELIFGIIVGNLCLTGITCLDYIRDNQPVQILAEIGIVLLLFQVGLESNLTQMRKVGASSLLAATFGVAASFGLGWGVSMLFAPNASVYIHAFTATMICSSSIGIAARVFADLDRIRTGEARTVLGAAVIDDCMGLVILAIVVPIITSADSGQGSLSAAGVAVVIAKAVGFLFGSVLIGAFAVPLLFKAAARFKSPDLLLATSLGLCFALGYVASLMGLAPIIGAFAAGLILEEFHWRKFTERGEHSVSELVKPLVGFLGPVFFFVMGTRVDLTTFANPHVLLFAGALSLAAILGKQACGLGVIRKGIDRLSVGIGMIPRGEVILIAAGVGRQINIGGQPVVSPEIFSAIVILVVVTTVITPPLLKWSLTRHRPKNRPSGG